MRTKISWYRNGDSSATTAELGGGGPGAVSENPAELLSRKRTPRLRRFTEGQETVLRCAFSCF